MAGVYVVNLYLVVTPSRHIVPASPEDRAKLRAFKPGDMLPCKFTKPRNGDHHRKFMALVSFVASHHPSYRSVDALLVELKMRTGHYDHYVRKHTGEVVYVPKSISFDEMDEGDFIVWSARAREVLFAEMFPEFTERDRERLHAEIEGWLAWT
jgi:hypothetical protein